MQLVTQYSPLADLLAQVEEDIEFLALRESGVVGAVARELMPPRGNRLRATVLLLSAECAGGATQSSLSVATVAELTHIASVVHDQVADDAPCSGERRSAGAARTNQVSVLAGDYLIALAFDRLMAGAATALLPDLVQTATRACAGRVDELRAREQVISTDQYLEIVRAKTGSLFGFCGKAGVQTVGGPAEAQEALRSFGERFGVAYHLANDVRDLLGDNSRPGNQEKQELGGHRLTLPLVLAAEQADGDVRAQLEQMVAVKEVSPQQLEAAREIAASTGAIEDARGVVHSWLDAARQELGLLPDGAAKHALLALARSACLALVEPRSVQKLIRSPECPYSVLRGN